MKLSKRDAVSALAAIAAALTPVAALSRTFVHPGLTYTQGDLDRMKAMVEAREEPFYSTFLKMKASSYSSASTNEYSRGGAITSDSGFENTVGIDGRCALDTAILWRITGDELYAKSAVARINANSWYTNTCDVGTAALDNGKFTGLIEAAELLRDYPGWKAEDRQRFFDMLVYPGYSSVDYPWNEHPGSTCGPYWGVYNFDAMRYGNQGLIGCCAMLAMGVLLDNEKIFDRAIRYFRAQPHRSDDLPYVSGPANLAANPAGQDQCQIYSEPQWPRVLGEYEDLGYDEQLKHYIYPNGQCQESCRDQGHVMAGVSTLGYLAEVAWNQGVDLYGELDNRILKGWEWSLRLNLTGFESYDDQPRPWFPSAVTTDIDDISFDNEKFYRVRHRSGRWESLWIATDRRDVGATTPIALILNHYAVRALRPASEMTWLYRSQARQETMCDGVETCQTGAGGFGMTAWGTLTKSRRPRMAGDPGTWKNGVRVSGAHALPATIPCADFDWYSDEKSGDGFTYHDTSSALNSTYRADATVGIRIDSAEGAVVTETADGEWTQYTFVSSGSGMRNVEVRYRSANAASIALQVDEGEMVSVPLPASDSFSTASAKIRTPSGAHVLRMTVVDSGDGGLELKSLAFGESFDERLVWMGANNQYWHAKTAWSNSVTYARVTYEDDADIMFATPKDSYSVNNVVLTNSVAPNSMECAVPAGRTIRVTGDYALDVAGESAFYTGTLALATASNDLHIAKLAGGSLSLESGITVLGMLGGGDTGTVSVASSATLALPGGTLSDGIAFDGAGTISVRAGKTVSLSSIDTMANFEGTVVVSSGSTLGDVMPYNDGARFGANATVRLEGGALSLGYKSNNVRLPAIEVPAGCTGTVWNTTARGGNGQNATMAKALSGSGTLVIAANDRWLHMEGDNSGFSGTLVLDGWGGDSASVLKASAGGPAQWVCKRSVPFLLDLSDSSSISIGALSVGATVPNVESRKTGQSLVIGARVGGVNGIDAPLTGYALSIVKNGSDPLVLGTRFSEENAGTISVNGGELVVLATNVQSAVSIASGASLAVAEGIRFASLSLPAGAEIRVIGSTDWRGGERYLAMSCASVSNLSSASISLSSLPPGISGSVEVSGNAVYVRTTGALVWNGASGDDWLKSGAWLNDANSSATFSQGGDACFSRGTFAAAAQTNEYGEIISYSAATAVVAVAGSVTAGDVWIDVPTNTELSVEGAGAVSANSVSLSGGGTLALKSGWVGDVALADGSRLAFAADARITDGALISGSGDVEFRSGSVWIDARADSENNPFRGLCGDVTVLSGAYVSLSPNAWCPDSETMPPFGRGTLRLAGGTVEGFWKRNNAVLGPVEAVAGTSSWLLNTSANSMSGVNLKLNGPITGSGAVEVRSNGRWVSLSGDNTAFEGELAFTGSSPQPLTFANAESGMPYGSVRLDAARQLVLSHAAGTTMRLGGLVVTNVGAAVVLERSALLEIGRRNGDSLIDVPVTGVAPSIHKLGIGDLKFGAASSLPDGASVSVANGSLTIATNVFLGSLVSIGRGTVLHGDGDIGSLELCDGAIVDNGEDETIVAHAASVGDFVKRGEGRLVLPSGAGNVVVKGGELVLPLGAHVASLAVEDGASVTIDAADAISAAEDGGAYTVGMLALGTQMEASSVGRVVVAGIPDGSAWRVVSGKRGLFLRRETLVWNGGASWCAEGAWRGETSGASLTFADGDDVKITGGSIPLCGDAVRPAAMTISGGPSIVGAGEVDPVSLSNDGTIHVRGDGDGGALRFGAAASGSFVLADGAHLAVPCGTSFNWLRIDETSALVGVAASDWSAGETRTIVRWNYTDELGVESDRLSVTGLAGGLTAQVDVGDRVATALVGSLFVGTSPAEVIGLNFGAGFFNANFLSTNSLMRGYESCETLAGAIPGMAWNNLYETIGSNVAASVAWNGESAFTEPSGVEVTYNCNNLYGIANGKPNYLRGYFDDWKRTEILVENIPWPQYDVVVYASTDTMNTKFLPMEVNGTSYTWNSSLGRTVAGTSAWGDSSATSPASGVNALVLTDLVGETLSITGSVKSGSFRGGIAALQIVNRMPLVWNGGSAGMRDAGKWLLFDSAADYGDGRGVAFSATGLAGTASPTATVVVASVANPVRVFADVPSGRGYILQGSGALTAGRLAKRGLGSFDVACPSSFTNGLDVAEGSVALSGTFSGAATVAGGAQAELRGGGAISLLSGRGMLRVTGGTLTVDSLEALATFGGTLSVESATLDAPLPFHAENTLTQYGLGEKTTLRLSNASVPRLTANKTGSNNTWLPAVESVPGTENVIYNQTSRSQKGMNLRLRKTLSGGGRMRFVCQDRSLEMSWDASAFAGEISVEGPNGAYGNTTILGATNAVNANMRFDYTRGGELSLAAGDGARFAFGALNVAGNCSSVSVSGSGVVATIGGLGGDSAITVPFTGSAFSLVKTGSGSLALSGTATMVPGTTLRVVGGSVSVGSISLLVYGGASSISSGLWIALEVDGSIVLYPSDLLPAPECGISIGELQTKGAPASTAVFVGATGAVTTAGEAVKYRIWTSPDLSNWTPGAISDSSKFTLSYDKPREFYKVEVIVPGGEDSLH